jgi:hypothetical protein
MFAVYSLTTLPTAVDVAAHYADYAEHDAEPKTTDEALRRGNDDHFFAFLPLTGLNFLNVFPTEHPPANVTTSSATIQIVYWVVVNMPYLRGMYM